MTAVPEGQERYNEKEMTSKETTAQIFKTDERHQGKDLSGHIYK